MGRFGESESYLKAASQAYLQSDETVRQVAAQLNLAELAHLQGRYREALKLILSLDNVQAEVVPVLYARIRRELCATYLALNRYTETRELASQTIDLSRQATDAKQELGYLLRFLAIAQAESWQLAEAHKSV